MMLVSSSSFVNFFSTLPSQSPVFGAQSAIVQRPPEQPGVPAGTEHVKPQMPQFAASVRMSVSQPLSALPSQLPQPLVQAIWQVPEGHDGVPFDALHVFVQFPQLVIEFRLVSQPFVAVASQLANPELQVMPH